MTGIVQIAFWLMVIVAISDALLSNEKNVPAKLVDNAVGISLDIASDTKVAPPAAAVVSHSRRSPIMHAKRRKKKKAPGN